MQFKRFKILGLLPVDAPPGARGKLDTTYLDDMLRVHDIWPSCMHGFVQQWRHPERKLCGAGQVSRGDRGNLFILEKAAPLS